MMCLARMHDPKAIDEEQIAGALAQGRESVVVQFSHRGAYDATLLRALNSACERFGARLQVRFYAHGWKRFDCGVLSELPAVRALTMDTLRDVGELEVLGKLGFLEEFAFGVFEAAVPDLLCMPALTELRKLRLIEARKSNIDLKPLAGYAKLEDLFLNRHATNIGALAGNSKIRRLGLSQMRRQVGLGFVGSMSGIRTLRVILGGRQSLDELANSGVEELEVIRVQGLESIELEGFPRLKTLKIEDQLRVTELDLAPVAGTLEHLKVVNCKGLQRLAGLKGLTRLRALWLGGTKVIPDELLESLPAGLERVSIFGYGSRRDEDIKGRLGAAGYVPVSGDFAH